MTLIALSLHGMQAFLDSVGIPNPTKDQICLNYDMLRPLHPRTHGIHIVSWLTIT